MVLCPEEPGGPATQAPRERTDGGPVRRAMGNLRTVLLDRLSRDGVQSETMHEVAAILDEAARKIERL